MDSRCGIITGFSEAGMKSKSSEAVRPRKADNREDEWVQGVDEEGEITIEDEEVPPGERKVKKMMNPLLPSAREVEEHNISHLPFRNWCPHCVKGRGREADHRRQPRTEHGVDEFHLDYCFPGDEMGHKLTILVGVERYSGMKMCSVVPTKGATGAFAARKVIELVDECGNKDANIILKTD